MQGSGSSRRFSGAETLEDLVIGVGNLLRRDDGVGVHVVIKLKKLTTQIDAVNIAMRSV